MKRAEINLEVPELRQGRVSEPQLGEGTQQSPPPFHSWNLFKMYIYTHTPVILIWGGVRLRSRLSPGGGRNQKCHFKAKTDQFFINSFIYRAYYVISYKKWIKRLKILISLHLQWDWGPNREILPEICISFQNAICLWFSYQKTNSA